MGWHFHLQREVRKYSIPLNIHLTISPIHKNTAKDFVVDAEKAVEISRVEKSKLEISFEKIFEDLKLGKIDSSIAALLVDKFDPEMAKELVKEIVIKLYGDWMKLLLTLGFILITFASQSIWVTFSPVLSNVAEELGVQTALVGYLAVLYPLFFLILTIPSGILLDRNFRFWLTFGSVATFLGGTLRLLMPYSYAWLFSCQLFAAIGQPFLLNGFVPFASRLYEKKRALMISIMSLLMYLGTIFALATGYYLYTAGGVEMLIVPSAIISIAGILLFLAGILLIGQDLSATGFAFKIRDVVGKRDLWLLGCILGLGVAVFDSLAT